MPSDRFAIDRRRLPPLNALTAFEAAARRGSFAGAAAELNLTAGAISKQIKSLEDHLGVALFERVRQRVHLTEAGRFLALQVRQTLGRLLAVSDQASQLRGPLQVLNVGILPAVANHWLIPRLPRFVKKYPHVTLNLLSIVPGFEFDNTTLDAAIDTGPKNFVDSVTYWIGSEEAIVVATPDWLARHRVRAAADLLDQTLLVRVNRAAPWTRWFQQNGVEVNVMPRQFLFGHYDMVLVAVLASLGAAMVPRMLVDEELRTGRLAEIPGKPVAATDGYFLIHPLHRESFVPLQNFRDWLLEEAPGATQVKDAAS